MFLPEISLLPTGDLTRSGARSASTIRTGHWPKHLTPPHPINVDASVIFAATKQRLSSAREIRA
jgi:hypothetical protein